MSVKINRYSQFINEEFFKKIFNNSMKKNKTTKLSRVDSCVVNILDFLSENDVYNWDGFMKMSQFDRDVINKLIDTEVNSMDELKEVILTYSEMCLWNLGNEPLLIGNVEYRNLDSFINSTIHELKMVLSHLRAYDSYLAELFKTNLLNEIKDKIVLDLSKI